MKYADIQKGRRAERALVCPVPGSETGLPCVAVPLVGDEESECVSFALKYATERGVKPELAKLGDTLYDLADYDRVWIVTH